MPRFVAVYTMKPEDLAVFRKRPKSEQEAIDKVGLKAWEDWGKRNAAAIDLVIVGATTNHCVETTTRMAGNLGFKGKLVRDGTWTFDRDGIDGETFSADRVHAMTLANLNGEFAEILTAAEVSRRLGAS